MQVLSKIIKPDQKVSAQKIQGRVVIQLARLGDFLQTSGLLAALKQKDPACPLSVVVPKAVAPLAKACEFVDNTLILDPATLVSIGESTNEPSHLALARLKGLLEPVWQTKAHEVFNLNLGIMGAALSEGWGEADLKGWQLDRNNWKLKSEPWCSFVMGLVNNRRLTRLHLTDILASYADCSKPATAKLSYRVLESDKIRAQELVSQASDLVVLQLGANNNLRRWPVANFADLANGLIEKGFSIALVGSYGEKILARRLLRLIGKANDQVFDLMGKTDLAQLGGILSQAKLVVSCDTGTLHLATACGAKVLALFMGPAQVHETGPYGGNHLVIQARDSCGPCQENNPVCKGKAPCRQLITSQSVLRISEELLRGVEPFKAIKGIDFSQGVEPLISEMDDFGVRYKSLRTKPMTFETGLALGLRQGGRVLMRSYYDSDPCSLEKEIKEQFESCGSTEKAYLARSCQNALALSRAAMAQDQKGAQRILSKAKELACLGGLIGKDQPFRLKRALMAAGETMALAADI